MVRRVASPCAPSDTFYPLGLGHLDVVLFSSKGCACRHHGLRPSISTSRAPLSGSVFLTCSVCDKRFVTTVFVTNGCACRRHGLRRILDDYKMFPGLHPHWVKVDATATDSASPAGGVLWTYKQCEHRASSEASPIANRFFLTGFGDSVHDVRYPVSYTHLTLPTILLV